MPVSQGSVRVGTITVPRTHEDAPALAVLGRVLARRIFNTVRSVHGLSYQASASFEPSWRNDSPFTITFQTKCASVPFAVHLAREEVRALIADGPTPEEMVDARRSLDSGFRRAFGRGADSAEAFAELEENGVPLAFYAGLRQAYGAVDAQRVQQVAARYLAPDGLLVLCVGDVDAMKEGDGVHPMLLADLGAMTLHVARAAPGPSSPASVALAVLDALKAGDTDALRARCTESFRKRIEEDPEATAYLGMLPRLLAGATVAEPEVTLEDEAAKVRVPVKATVQGSAMELLIEMSMVRVDDAWRVDAVKAGPAR